MSCFSTGSEKQREEKLNSQANAFGGQKCHTALEGEAGSRGMQALPLPCSCFLGLRLL